MSGNIKKSIYNQLKAKNEEINTQIFDILQYGYPETKCIIIFKISFKNTHYTKCECEFYKKS